MHRTFSVPRLVGFASLLAALTLVVPGAAHAQQPFQVNFAQGDQPKIDQQGPAITLAVGTVQTYTAKNNLKSVDNPNGKILNITPTKDLRVVRLEGLAPGRTQVTFIDVKDNREVVDIIIISDRVKELRELLARSVPTASVNVTSTDSGNTVILTGTALTVDDLRAINQLAGAVGGGVINNVRIGGVQQVQLEVIVAIVNRTEGRNMAFSWNINGPNWFVGSLLGGPFAFASAITPAPAGATSALTAPSGGANLPFGVLNNNGSFLGYLQALRTEGVVKIMAEPRITTLSGRPAYIVSGGETPILTSGGTGAPSVSYRQFGTVVHVLPVVLGNGKIHLEVRPEISQPDPSLNVSIGGVTPTVVPGFRTRSAQATVQIEDGQTLAIGGLIQNNVTGNINRVPVLGDMPYVGVFFTAKTFTEVEEELIILVTPRLVDPIDCTKFPQYLPGRETRNPDDFELFLEGILEAPRGQRTVNFHPGLYKPAFHGSPNAGQIPCGTNYGSGHIGGRYIGGCANGNCGVPTSSYRPGMHPTTPGLAMPSHGYQEMPVSNNYREMPTGNNYRLSVEPEPMPPMRQPGLGPVTPTATPLPPAREFESRPTLPPVSPGVYYSR